MTESKLYLRHLIMSEIFPDRLVTLVLGREKMVVLRFVNESGGLGGLQKAAGTWQSGTYLKSPLIEEFIGGAHQICGAPL